MAFAGLLGLLLGLGFLKFGNPVILDRLVDLPRGWDEWRVFAWPIRIGYAGLAVVTLLGLRGALSGGPPRAPRWLIGLVLGWLAWQFAAALRSTDPASTAAILPHLVACVVCLALGHLALARVAQPRVFWIGILLGFIGVLGVAFDQRFGGLEATRKMILEREDAARLPAEYLARIHSGRVFGTLVYPNALAGLVLLILPPAVLLAGRYGARWGNPAAWTARAVLGLAGLAVLVWSGSKAGWLLAMAAGLVVLFHRPMARRCKVATALTLLAAGLAAFAWLYAEKLSRGATSVAARLDYWTAAVQGAAERPWLGHGPGAFKRYYAATKAPESEMAQLAHNDYLQQAIDSGLPGAALYTAFIVGALGWVYARHRRQATPAIQVVWLGLATWFAQGMVEFGLYIPATSWCAFVLLGWLLAQTPFPARPANPTLAGDENAVSQRSEPESPRHPRARDLRA